MAPRSEDRSDDIIDVVLDILQKEGYDAVQVRTVASRAHVSLATMYKLFGTLDELIVASIQRWMATNTYAEPAALDPAETPYESFLRVLETVFAPWERHPEMLRAFHRAGQTDVGRERLVLQGTSFARPVTDSGSKNLDPELLGDVALIVGYMLHTALDRFSTGQIEVTDIVPILERPLFRLLGDGDAKGNGKSRRRTRRPALRRQ